MKSKNWLFTILCISPLLVSAQDEVNKGRISYYPFQKGNWGYPLERKIDFGRYTDFDDGNKLGNGTEFSINFDKVYFLGRNIGIDLEYCMDWWDEEDYSETDWTGRLGLIYGTPLSERINLYAEFGGIYGKNRYEQPSNPNVQKNHSSGYFFEAGLPVHLNSNVFFTPKINWSRVTTEYANGEEVKNGFGFSVGLESYMGLDEAMCDHKQGYSLSKDKYSQGNNYFNFQTMGNFRFGNGENSFTTPIPPPSEYDFSGGRLGVNYRYYIIDNLALGAKLNYRTSTQENENGGYKTTNSKWSISPRLTYNLPLNNGWNNWFLEAGVGFGSSKNKAEYPNTTNESKYNDFNYGFWTGYNFFFTDRLALTPQVGYKSATSKFDGTGNKSKTRSLDLEIGVQYNFRY